MSGAGDAGIERLRSVELLAAACELLGIEFSPNKVPIALRVTSW